MKLATITLFSSMLMLNSIACVQAQTPRMQSFDEGWRFFRGDALAAEDIGFDDSRWREVIVPHDFSMEPVAYASGYREQSPEWSDWQVGPFSRLSIGDSDSGQTVGGEGWYRKSFDLPISPGSTLDEYLSHTRISLRFDGVYNQAEVWVNGQKAAINVYGYAPFSVNLNEVLRKKSCRNGQDERRVTIAVKSVNQGLNCRWYSGSGIYRHVWLEQTPMLHLDEWDTWVDASELKGKRAVIKVSTKVFNETETMVEGTIRTEILDALGKVVSTASKPFSTTKGEEEVSVQTELKSPQLWSDVSPYRYKARVSIMRGAEQVDCLTIPFGVRSIEFSADKGFLLNGKPTLLRGGCVHHDNGLLGSAAIDRAELRKVELLKAQGFNAIRCSHNLPSVAFLNACDSLGMLVIDECFDQWEEAKRQDDYSNYFSKEKMKVHEGKVVGMGITNFEYDAALMVRRDRNHPSVIMWSIGNEIAQRSDLPRGKELAEAIIQTIHGLDTTRPTTMGFNDFWDRSGQFTWEEDSPRAFAYLDVCGYNYETRRYETDHELFPKRIIYGSETYPNAIGHNWNLVERHPYLIGDFVWTAVDYIGETGLGHALERSDHGAWIQLLTWPWFNAWCGDLDLVGNKKPQSYYRDVVWRQRPMAMAVRPSVPDGEWEDAAGWCWTAEENHWNWFDDAYYDGPSSYLPLDLRPEKYDNAILKRDVKHDVNARRCDSLWVNVYTREKRVSLLLNGEVLGEKEVNPDNFTASFRVAYRPGTLRAVATDGRRMKHVQAELVTSKAPAALQFEAVSDTISSSHNDLAYIYVKVVDEDGRLCPTAEIPLDIRTSGCKHLAVAGTGHPFDMKSFRSMTPTTFRGQALIILQPQEEKGQINVSVTSERLSGTFTCTTEVR